MRWQIIPAPPLVHPNGNIHKFAGGNKISELTKEQSFDLIHGFKGSKTHIDIVHKMLAKATDRQTTIQSRAMPQLQFCTAKRKDERIIDTSMSYKATP